MPNCYPKIKPTHYRAGVKWETWPFGEISAKALLSHSGSQPRQIQGLVVRELYGGLRANNTYWHWSCEQGFTEGVYANGAFTK